jgi:hypothetical protein
LAIAAQQSMYLMQFDIQTAFLNGLIDTVIYMLQPPGFEVEGPAGLTLVCLILRNLYGFKQFGIHAYIYIQRQASLNLDALC